MTTTFPRDFDSTDLPSNRAAVEDCYYANWETESRSLLMSQIVISSWSLGLSSRIFQIGRNFLKKSIKDQESAVTRTAIGEFWVVCWDSFIGNIDVTAVLSSMTAVTFYKEGERAVEEQREVGRREEACQGLVFTVDHNNFLPCVAVSLKESSGIRLQYKPVWLSISLCHL